MEMIAHLVTYVYLFKCTSPVSRHESASFMFQIHTCLPDRGEGKAPPPLEMAFPNQTISICDRVRILQNAFVTPICSAIVIIRCLQSAV